MIDDKTDSAASRRTGTMGLRPIILPLVLAVLLTGYQFSVLFSLPAPPLDVDYPLFGDQEDVSNKEFSACLLVMDDNAYLIEWLAYHYHSLPLRRLIVARDPRSRTSPSEILARYEGLMDITEWQDKHYFPEIVQMSIMKKEPWDALRPNANKLVDLHRFRQRYFYSSCMKQLQQENQTWTALVDSDEFIVLNRNSVLWNYKRSVKSTTILVALKRATFARELRYSPCVSMPRLFFGTKESTVREVQNSVPDGFNGSEFLTFHRRYTPNPQDVRTNRAGKAMMDVSRVDPEELRPININPHVPLKSVCGQDSQWIQSKKALFVVHHYVGTFEQWSFRQDPRKTPNGTRSREQFHQLAFDKNEDDNIRPWLGGLIDELGYDRTRLLLLGVGQLPKLET
jgi:hypothetical protein